MSDLLSGLTDYDINPFDLGTMYENPEGGGRYVCKDDVREALTNPTDKQVEALTAVAWNAINQYRPAHEDQWERVVRAVLAAAAEGEQ